VKFATPTSATKTMNPTKNLISVPLESYDAESTNYASAYISGYRDSRSRSAADNSAPCFCNRSNWIERSNCARYGATSKECGYSNTAQKTDLAGATNERSSTRRLELTVNGFLRRALFWLVVDVVSCHQIFSILANGLNNRPMVVPRRKRKRWPGVVPRRIALATRPRLRLAILFAFAL